MRRTLLSYFAELKKHVGTMLCGFMQNHGGPNYMCKKNKPQMELDWA
jgi:hypothetical protein